MFVSYSLYKQLVAEMVVFLSLINISVVNIFLCDIQEQARVIHRYMHMHIKKFYYILLFLKVKIYKQEIKSFSFG